MQPVRLSPIRRFLMAWFDPSRAVPYVSANVAIDFHGAQRYLAELEQAGRRVTIQALLTAALGRVYAEFPQINRRIIGRRIYQCPEVGIGAPVNLLGHEGGAKMELSAILLQGVDRLSLVEVGERLEQQTQAERSGRPTHPLVRALVGLTRHAPGGAVELGMAVLGQIHRREALASVSWFTLPASVGLSNPGAVFAQQPGIWVRGAAVALPTWPVHVGSLMGVSSVQDEVVAVDGVPAVRPVLPVVYIFDHRLIDGVMAGRVLTRFAQILADPAREFGPDAQTRPDAPARSAAG